MKTSSAKAKGRRAQQWLRDRVREFVSYQNYDVDASDDVRSTPMGVSGEDLTLSRFARGHFPFASECKNSERVGFWPTVQQAEANAGNHIPLLLFMKNRTKPWIAIPAEDFFTILNLASNWADEYADTLQDLIQKDQT